MTVAVAACTADLATVDLEPIADAELARVFVASWPATTSG